MSRPRIVPANGADAPVIGGVELSKSRRKVLSSLGHQITRFAAACDRLRTKEKDHPSLEPWFRVGSRHGYCSLKGEGVFACPVTTDGPRLILDPLAATTEQCAAAISQLPSEVRDRAEPLAIPASLNEPLWPSLLRLRPLREFWERELRRDTVTVLLDVLPDSWLLDPTPLPPGGVIPRLEIASWSDLDTLARKFIPAAPSDIAAILGAYPDAPGVLKSVPSASSDAISFFSLYRKSDTRVDWLGVVGRQPSAGH